MNKTFNSFRVVYLILFDAVGFTHARPDESRSDGVIIIEALQASRPNRQTKFVIVFATQNGLNNNNRGCNPWNQNSI